MVNVTAVIAIGGNGDGYREILGVDVITSEDGAGRLAFLRSLVLRPSTVRPSSRSACLIH